MKPRKSTPNDYGKGMTKGGLENAGSKFTEDKLGNSVKHWEKGATKNIYREFDHDIRVNSNRALNIGRPGRAKGATAKLEQLQTARTAGLSKVSKIGKAGRFAAKLGPVIGFEVINVLADYKDDYNNGLSDSKHKSNMLVNIGFAGAGIAVACAVSGPIGWAAGLGIVATKLFFGDYIKNKINSLD